MTHVLIVEDEAPVARLYRHWAELEGATVTVATSAEQALMLAAVDPPAVAFCDIRLPGGRDGFWFATQVRRLHPPTAVVMTTGLHDFEAAVVGLRAGITDYLVKPFTSDKLRDALRRALAEHAARSAVLAADSAWLPPDEAMRRSTMTTAALLAILQSQDGVNVWHAQRVAHLATKLAKALGLPEIEVSHIEHAALLCEVGRVDIYAAAPRVPYLAAVTAIAVAAQERFDGTGFPAGLRGDAIPIGARVVAVAAAYEELVTRGPTRTSPLGAVETLGGDRAHEFDPAVLRALRALGAPAGGRGAGEPEPLAAG